MNHKLYIKLDEYQKELVESLVTVPVNEPSDAVKVARLQGCHEAIMRVKAIIEELQVGEIE